MNEQEFARNIQAKIMSGIPLESQELDFFNSFPDSKEKQILSIQNKKNSKQKLTAEEQNISDIVEKSQFDSLQPQEKLLFKTKKLAQDEKRVIHLSDTHSSAKDLEDILGRNLYESQHNKKTDVIVHTGDLIEDFMDIRMSQGLGVFRSKRIIAEGKLEGEIAKEFENVYDYLLEKHGISDSQLLEGQITENIQRAIQGIYFGGMPNFLTNEQKAEYTKNFEIFKKHLKLAIKNDATTKYGAIKDTFKKLGLSAEDLILIPGNHDVPDVMEKVLGEYMPKVGTVVERKGMKFAAPLSGSTGAFMGPEFVDTFGYVDFREKIEQAKYGTKAFQDLKNELIGHGMKLSSDKDLSQLISISQMRSSQGIGKGGLSDYFEKYIKPEINSIAETHKGKIVSKIPKGVDFYLTHGMPNHPHHAGIEEKAFYDALKDSGGTILHGHEHQNTTHKKGNTLLLNNGKGTENFGVYFHDKKNGISDIFSRVYNKTLGDMDYSYFNKKQLKTQPDIKEYN